MPIEIDIRTRILPDDHSIFLLFPGRSYKYSDLMIERQIAFIDLPNIPDEIFDDSSKSVRETLSDEMVVRSILIKRYRETVTPFTQEEYIDHHLKNLLSQRNRFSVQKAAFSNFHSRPKKGDVVVIPGPLYKSPVLIGEFSDDPGVIEQFLLPDSPDLRVQARKIRWLASPEKQTLPGSLVSRLPSSNPFRNLERSEYKTIYDIGYGSYKYRDLFVSQFKFDKEVLRGDTTLFMGLYVYFISKIHDKSINGLYLTEIDLSFIDMEFIDKVIGEFEQRININSPGQYVFSRRNITPILISATLAAFAASGFLASTSSFDVNITNSLQKDSAADEINKKIETELKTQWQGINGDNLDRLAKSAKKMTEGGVTPRARRSKN